MKTKNNLTKQESKITRKRIIVAATGVIIIGGMAGVIIKQQGNIKTLTEKVAKTESDVKILKEVMHGNVLNSMKETYKRKLRYAEGRLAAGLHDHVMSSEDAKMRKEEIEFFNKQIATIMAAESLLDP